MNAEQLRSLARLLDYIADDERKHFEASSPGERDNPIHPHILILPDDLEQQGDPNS